MGKLDKTAASGWFVRKSPNASPRLRLFCFPYAGGGAAAYRTWPRSLPADIEVIPVELPGRGSRLAEPAFKRVPALIDGLTEAILPVLGTDFAFFGHSMGAVIAFELAREIRRRRGIQPRHLFASGRRAPQIPDDDPRIFDLPYDEFVAELKTLNGTPKEV
ncbi:MAG TPA: alpha/beta fold hydrolase, partial [Blastocatellia bacterium]|nr:alpha/beta fold hydrolase [Blastocatellia bacterium]